MFPCLNEDDFVSDLFCFNQSNGADDYTQFGVNLNQDFGSYGPEFNIDTQFGVLPQELVGCGIVDREELEVDDSGSSGGVVKEELDNLDDECSRKRGRTGIKAGGSKACRERLRREKLNERFMDLSSVLEPGRSPKTDKPAILDDAIRVLKQLRDEAHELEETNQKLLDEIKSLKAEKNELREEKLSLKAEKEKTEEQLKSSMVIPSAGFMPQGAFGHNKMAVYPSYGYMPMWHYLPQSVCDTSRDEELRPPAA